MTFDPHQQRFDALERAEHVRRSRAAFRRHLASLPSADSARHAITTLEALPSELETMTAARFLASVRRLGEPTANRILARHGISAIRQMRQLTARQRQVLTLELYRHGQYSSRPAPAAAR